MERETTFDQGQSLSEEDYQLIEEYLLTEEGPQLNEALYDELNAGFWRDHDLEAEKEQLATLVHAEGLPLEYPSDKWDIVDVVDVEFEGDSKQLYMLHFRYGLDYADRHNSVRGVVVSLEYGVVCPGLPRDIRVHTRPTTQRDMISNDQQGNLIINQWQDTMTIPAYHYEINPYYEGVTLRIFKFAGKVFVSTYRKIDLMAQTDNNLSRFGSVVFKPLFQDMQRKARGFDPEKLFDEAKPYSSFAYYYIMQSPLLTTLSRHRPTDLLIFVRGLTNALPRAGLDPQLLEITAHPQHTYTQEGLVEAQTTHALLMLTKTGAHTANLILRNGNNPANQRAKDHRLTNGESLMIYHLADDGSIAAMYHVMGPAATWRIGFHPRNNTLKGALYNDLYRYRIETLDNDEARRDFSRRFVFPAGQKAAFEDAQQFNRLVARIIKDNGWFGRVARPFPNNTFPYRSGEVIKLAVRQRIVLFNYILATSPGRSQELQNYYLDFNSAVSAIPKLITAIADTPVEELTPIQRLIHRELQREERHREELSAEESARRGPVDVTAFLARVKFGNIEDILAEDRRLATRG